MPYISTELVKKIRGEIKKEFPGFKFSIRREHYSSLSVDLLSCSDPAFLPLNGAFGASVNHFYIREHYEDNPGVRDVLLKINDIMNQKNGVECLDSDYGTIPSYYININIGQWDRPFLVTEPLKIKL